MKATRVCFQERDVPTHLQLLGFPGEERESDRGAASSKGQHDTCLASGVVIRPQVSY